MDGDGDLLSSVLERPEREWAAALDELCAAHADRAGELRRRFAVLERLGLAQQATVAALGPADRLPDRFGPYRLVQRLGGGGMGIVYLAQHEQLGRNVALKLIRPERLFFGDARARFQREITAVARLEHPDCVQIHQVGETDGVPYFAMEHIAGISLDELIAGLRDQPPARLTGQDVARVLQQAAGAGGETTASELSTGPWVRVCLRLALAAAEALSHAHARGVVHRDLKPSNLMLTPQGRLVVIDFGLAVAEGTDKMTQSGAFLGSLPYMAPEQVRGERHAIDARTDVYALGVCLYELLTLASPFEAPSPDTTRARILSGTVLPLRARNPAIGSDVAVLCARAMDLEPERRYQTAAAMAGDLVAALEHRAIRARPLSLGLRVRRWARREPWQAVALGVLLLGLVTSTTGFVLAAARAAENARLAADEKQAKLQLAASLRDFDLLSGVPLYERAVQAELTTHPAWRSVSTCCGRGSATTWRRSNGCSRGCSKASRRCGNAPCRVARARSCSRIRHSSSCTTRWPNWMASSAGCSANRNRGSRRGSPGRSSCAS